MPLHKESADFVNSLAEQDPPGWHEMPPSQSREIFASLDALFGPKVGIDDVTDVHLSLKGCRSAVEGNASADEVRCRLYSSSEATSPVTIYFHGGGWVLGNLDSHDALCRQLANSAQCSVLSVDYRLSPEAKYPLPMDDCVLALNAARLHAEQLNIDPTRITLAGDSAGGNLAAATAMKDRDDGQGVESLVLIYPVVQPEFETGSYQQFATGHGLTRETMQWFWCQYLGDDLSDAKYAKLLDCDLAGLPRTLVLTAEYDVLRDEGELLAERLHTAGVPAQLTRYDGMLHGFVHFAGHFSDAQVAIGEIASFINA